MEFKITNQYSHDKLMLNEMAEVGRVNGYKISIYGAEGPIIHFHFWTTNSKKGGCIRLDKPEYFKHGKHTEELDAKNKKDLIEWLKSPHKSFGKYDLSNWQIICIYWDDNNPDWPFNKEAEMPDYNLL